MHGTGIVAGIELCAADQFGKLGNAELCIEKVVRTNLYTTEDGNRVAILDMN